MLLQPAWDWLEAVVFSLPSTAADRPLFNFYRDEAPGLDRPGAAAARRRNLRRSLERFTAPPRWLAVGEAPGWRGGRFSGTPFTSEAQLVGGRLGFVGEATSCAAQPYTEATATLFWQVIAGSPVPPASILAWNCVPLHPHQPDRPCSNRRPSLAETAAFLPLLAEFVRLVQPEAVIAVGRCAQDALHKAGIPAAAVRHPSHGGASAFRLQMKQAFENPADRL